MWLLLPALRPGTVEKDVIQVNYGFLSQDGVKASMICACSAFLAVYLRGPDSAPLETGCLEGRFSNMDVLDFVEQNARVPPRSVLTCWCTLIKRFS